MSVQYLGKVNNIVTVEKLKELTGITQGTFKTGDITFLKFKDDKKELLVASEGICNSITWNSISEKGCVLGKQLDINGITYLCRLLTGENGDASVLDNSEWKRFIVDLVPSNSDSNWSNKYTICQEDHYGGSTHCVVRGYGSVSATTSANKEITSPSYVWRPVLEKINSIVMSEIVNDLGDISSFNKFNYTVTDLSGGSFNVTEKVDGKIIRTLNNQSSGEFAFNIENFDSLTYGNHTIEIIADDPTASGNVTVTSKFNKIKSPVQPMPTNSNLKQVVLHNKELEKEISYQNFRLSEKLKNSNFEVSENESLSSMISKIKISNAPEWISKGNVWIGFASATASMMYMGSAVVDKKIYCIGGSNGKASTINQCYNTSDNTWVMKCALPFARSGATSTYVNKLIYCLGGYSSGALTTNQAYDPVTNTWINKTSMPLALNLCTSVAIDNKIYLMGGASATGRCYIYDTVTDTWTTIEIPFKYSDFEAEAIGDNVYLVYCSSDGKTKDMKVFNVVTNSWTTKPPINVERGYFKLSSSKGKLYCMGGYLYTNGFSYYKDDCEMYDPSTDTWILKKNMSYKKQHFAAECVDDSIYCIGGTSYDSKPIDTCECYIVG